MPAPGAMPPQVADPSRDSFAKMPCGCDVDKCGGQIARAQLQTIRDQGVQCRLHIFRTQDVRVLGVKSLSLIRQGQLIGEYTGRWGGSMR